MAEEAKKLRLYLANPFLTRQRIREWELKMEAKYAIELVNPFYDTPRADIEKIDNGENVRATRTDEKNVKLVAEDLKLMKECQGVLAIVNGALSYGTIMEIVYAGFFGKHVFIVVSNGQITHPWLQVHGTRLFSSFKEFEKCLKEDKKLNV